VPYGLKNTVQWELDLLLCLYVNNKKCLLCLTQCVYHKLNWFLKLPLVFLIACSASSILPIVFCRCTV